MEELHMGLPGVGRNIWWPGIDKSIEETDIMPVHRM